MTPKELLINALEIIHDPEHWTQGALARDSYGSSIDETNDNAMKYCSLGAIHKAWWDDTNKPSLIVTFDAKDILRKYMPSGITYFNDHSTHAQVVNAFEEAIKHA